MCNHATQAYPVRNFFGLPSYREANRTLELGTVLALGGELHWGAQDKMGEWHAVLDHTPQGTSSSVLA